MTKAQTARLEAEAAWHRKKAAKWPTRSVGDFHTDAANRLLAEAGDRLGMLSPARPVPGLSRR